MASRWTTSGSLVAGVAAAIGASACCAGPLLLVLLELAVLKNLVALEGLPALVCRHGLWPSSALRITGCISGPTECAPGDTCAFPEVQRRQRVIFWTLALMSVALMAFPLYASLFY